MRLKRLKKVHSKAANVNLSSTWSEVKALAFDLDITALLEEASLNTRRANSLSPTAKCPNDCHLVCYRMVR